jgi:dolichyl-phosphate-mannose--protein O-mannosyl transferase
MRKIRSFFQFIWNRPWIIIVLLVLFAFFLRIYHLGQIKTEIFDEVYFVNFAKNYLSGTTFFDIHPPLGKLIIALGIKIFGDTPFDWRIMSAIFGTMLVPLIYLTGKELAGKTVGIFAAIIVSFDGMLLVYSRLGLMDIFLVFFLFASFYAFLKFSNNFKFLNLILAGIFLGLAASVKYNGFLLWFLFLAIGFIKKMPLKKFAYDYFLALIMLPLAIYLGFFLFNFHGPDFLKQVYEWHRQSINYNLHLTATHPYGSRWWSWFLLLRPIWLYFQDVNGKYIGVDGLGNPLAWWSALAVVPLLLWGSFKKDKGNAIVLAGFLIFLLSWALAKRVLFIYHALPSFVFLSFGIALWLDKLLQKRNGKILTSIYFAVLIIFFIYFLPIWIGWPLSYSNFYHRMWLPGWI